MIALHFSFPVPDLQISFAHSLQKLRKTCLMDALLHTAARADIGVLDKELRQLVPARSLSILAGKGLRGEMVFAVPSMLHLSPQLLGYYRLILGYSQKDFYTSGRGFNVGRFKSMEDKGRLTEAARAGLPNLCLGLCAAAATLLDGVAECMVDQRFFHELSLLTLGPQLRGGANNARGEAGVKQVFFIMKQIVSHAVVEETPRMLRIAGATGNRFDVAFASDPDIVVVEEMGPSTFRNVAAIEIKGGKDRSNIHNRIGEAEKSHQKARLKKFTECWTIVNIDSLDLEKAHKESPSTDRFYLLHELADVQSAAYADFRLRLMSLTSVSDPHKGRTT